MATISEVSKVLASFRLFFPNFNPENIAASAKAWHEMIGHIPGDELQAAAASCMTEQGRAFAPSVGEVMGAVMRLRAQASGLPSGDEAWQQVQEGEHLYGSYRCPEYYRFSVPRGEEWSFDHMRECQSCGKYKELHPLVKKIAYQFGWPDHFPGDNPEADRAHFIRAYENEIKRETERQAQPIPVQKYIESHSVTGAIAALAEGMRK